MFPDKLAKPLNDLMNFTLFYKVKCKKCVIFRRKRSGNNERTKQISFRVSESEYEKLRSSAETLNMSVPAFVKKKAHGSRLVAPKLDKETRQSMVKDLSKLGANVNQIVKYCNQHQHEAPNYEGFEYNINAVRERLDEIWQSLN